jgi:hypothetical protein
MANKLYRGRTIRSNNEFGKENFKSLFEYYGFDKKDEKQYPVVSKILKQITPERIEKEVEKIKKIEIPPELQKWVREYEKVGERKRLLWNFWYRMFQTNSFPVFFIIFKKIKNHLRVLNY